MNGAETRVESVDPAEWIRLMKKRRLMRATVLGRVRAIQQLAGNPGRPFLLGTDVVQRVHTVIG